MLSKKAQISIEVLTILSILVVGAIIFGVYYLSNINTGLGNAPKVEDELTLNTSAPSTQPGTVTEVSITPAGEFSINLELDPDAASLPFTDFGIVVSLNNVIEMDGDMNVTKIDAKKYNDLLGNYVISLDCNYDGTPIEGTLENLDIPIGNNDGAHINLTFSCSTDGNYTFTISATGIDLNGNIKNPSPANIDKEITSSTPPADVIDLELYLDPSAQTPQGSAGNHKFGVRAEVTDFTEDENIYIKNIYVSEYGIPNADCYYDTTQIPVTGLSGPRMMIKTGDDYNLLLPEFSCLEAGKYDITLTAGLLGNTNRDVNKFIAKNIDGLRLELSLVPTDTNINQLFGVLAKVNNYNSDNNVSIKHIEVWKKRVGDYTGTNNYIGECAYDGTQIPKNTGLNVDLNLTKYGNDYNLLLNKFRCTTASSANIPYFIKLTVHDNLETYPSSLYDWNGTIIKQILNPSLPPFCYFNYDGSGIESDPYVIRTPTDLFCVRYYLSSDFIVGNYIDLNHTILSNDVNTTWYDDEKGWVPIGTFGSKFIGSLDGNGNYINNLYSKITAPDPNDSYTSLFSGLFLAGDGATLKNLNLVNVNINGFVGGALIGHLYHGIIENVNVTGNIVGDGAGLVSVIYDTNITGCSFTGNRTGGTESYRGGLINLVNNQENCGGDCYDENEEHSPSYITDSYFSGNFSNDASFSGGLIGGAQGAIIDNCYVTGTVEGMHGCTGGLVGGRPISINNSYSTADIIGTSSTGGLVGCSDINGRGPIINSYSTGNINAYVGVPYVDSAYSIGGLAGAATSIYNSYSTANITVNGDATGVGGLAGVSGNDINNSYSKGNIIVNGNGDIIGGLVGYLFNPGVTNSYSTGNLNISGTKSRVGGLIGRKLSSATVQNSYWDINTSGYSTSIDGYPRTTSDMTYPDYPNTYVGWDFSLWTDDLFGDFDNGGYPYLSDPDTRGGTCTFQEGLGLGSKQMICDDGLEIPLEKVTPSIIAETRKEENSEMEINYKPLFYN